MGRRRGRRLVMAIAVGAAAFAPQLHAEVVPPVTVENTLGHLVRQVCSYLWIEGLCAPTRFPDPGYRAVTEPHLDQPLQWHVGAVHEHSAYSDGDPHTRPADYFRAGRTGHNVADEGGDTGVILDFMWSSEHSDNAQIPITTSADCLDLTRILDCSHINDADHYEKWPATLRQARAATTDTFTAVRGFEWTNDYFNHMNVYFSTNFVNVKIDGSYLSMDVFWNWLREPVARGGGADALVTFNHPGGNPALTPFDGSLPINSLLARFPGGANWNDVAYVPDVDERVAGIEVNGGDDIEWYVKALTKGWHLGPVAAEDEHQREWSTSADGKTLVLARGRTPQDYYYAFQHHRTIAIHDELVGGAPGTKAVVPSLDFSADAGVPLGSTISGGGGHTLHFSASGLPAGSRVALISDTGGGQAAPIALDAADGSGSIAATHAVTAPSHGQDWYFAVVCPPEVGDRCGKVGEAYSAVTAPIWFR
jgi:hypothetical protein